MFYLICATPRTGSNLLAVLLQETGQAGHPGEYFDRANVVQELAVRCGLAGAEDVDRDVNRYVDGLRLLFERGGRFGIKAHFDQMHWALQHGFDLDARGPERVILCNRGDALGQAISLVKSSQTGAWVSAHEEREAPRFDPELITLALQRNAVHHAGWERLFQTAGIRPYRLCYERLCADIPGELGGVLDFLEVDPATVDVDAVVERVTRGIQVQRNAVNEDWRRRYREHLRDRTLLEA